MKWLLIVKESIAVVVTSLNETDISVPIVCSAVMSPDGIMDSKSVRFCRDFIVPYFAMTFLDRSK